MLPAIPVLEQMQGPPKDKYRYDGCHQRLKSVLDTIMQRLPPNLNPG
jgi:hypothetical protein